MSSIRTNESLVSATADTGLISKYMWSVDYYSRALLVDLIDFYSFDNELKNTRWEISKDEENAIIF